MPGKKPSQSKKSKEFYRLLLKIHEGMAQTATLNEALMTLVRFTTSVVGCERCTIFLNDIMTNELYSFIAQGNLQREIRILNNQGLVGWSFTHNQVICVANAYEDERFNPDIDQQTGYVTKSALCVPLRGLKGELMGVSQLLNKVDGDFTETDIDLVQAMTEQASLAIQSKLVKSHIDKTHQQELDFLNAMSDVASEIQLSILLEKAIAAITRILDAERSTLFINDEKTEELYTEVGEGLGKSQIRFPNHLGIAGSVFSTGKLINIPYAYSDLRFNPSFDRLTGYFTRSILAAPVKNKLGKVIGVTQVLNKKRGEFTENDESQLIAINAQISMAIENAKLFDDIQNMKNYNESILESMSNGVITVNENHIIVTCNKSGLRILGINQLSEIINKPAKDFFYNENKWIVENIEKIHDLSQATQQEVFMDAALTFNQNKISANITIQPLISMKQKHLGTMLLIEDITSEKRMKSTMSRYMSSELAEQLMQSGESSLGGTSQIATVLFSDIRSFTSISESLGPEGTVQMLNDYFTQMVDCIQKEKGMLDKFIGDAIMAVFGTPFPHEDDPDRAVRAAINMMRALNDFNKKREAKKLIKIDHGIGINTDIIVSGNIGSEKRMDYTVIGDGVNLASRIESLCKQYGAHILISEFTLKALRATYRTRQLDKVIVKGKATPAAIYEVLDYYDSETYSNKIELLNQFNNGIIYYNSAQWDKAIRCFEEALKIYSDDKPSKIYIDRCERLKNSPPGESWDGVWIMTQK